MKRPEDIRAAPKEWIALLQVACRFFWEEKIGDLLLYGSQAMSVYMKNPLRSKDLDFLSSQVSYRQVETLADRLSEIKGVEQRTTSAQARTLEHGRMTTFAIELRVNGKPFFVELFDRVLDGRSPSVLQPHILQTRRWGLEFWSPAREAIVVLRLAFRQPEGITRLNAIRLNRFIQENQESLRFKLVREIITEWGIEDWVEKNLVNLYSRNNIRILNDGKIIRGIERKIDGKQTATTASLP
jgi:hypothetical protein